MTALGSIGIGSLVTTAGYQLIQTQDISTAVGSVNFTGLDSSTDHAYKIEAQITSEGASATDVELGINNEVINGYRQYLKMDNTSRTAVRNFVMDIGSMGAGSINDYQIKIGFADNNKVQRRIIKVDEIKDIGPTMEWWHFVHYLTFPIANITELAIKTNVTNSIGSPSRFRLYKLTK